MSRKGSRTSKRVDPEEVVIPVFKDSPPLLALALLHSSHMYHEAIHKFANHGVKCASVEVDLAAMMAQKDKAVYNLTKGVETLFKKNKVDYVKGAGKFLSPTEISVDTIEGENIVVKGKNIIIATGSDVKGLPVFVTIDESLIGDGVCLARLVQAGVETDKIGETSIREFSTNVKVFTRIGDVITWSYVSHRAETMMDLAWLNSFRKRRARGLMTRFLGVVYTLPEVASVEKGGTGEGIIVWLIECGKFSNVGVTAGLCLLMKRERTCEGLCRERTDIRILGVHIMSSNAGELIHEAALALTYDASSEDIARTCHAHPTLSEALKEAAMATYDKTITYIDVY
ncbi:dihydrolipoamide dehydrogenase [Tanacetum coccineum]|uniref:Dihydrolipoamide dehydrogenase n=1 Tax=Tanacetum coccineum TaxID=301880 RepID=A0ABQ4WL50_9ASTR